MTVVAYDLYPDMAFAVENNLTYKSLPEVLAMADIVTLHAPYTKENHHLLNKENIAKMKRGVYLINTARGELVDTEALVWGLKEGIIAGLGSDLLEDEQILKDAPTPKGIGVPTSENVGKNDKILDLIGN